MATAALASGGFIGQEFVDDSGIASYGKSGETHTTSSDSFYSKASSRHSGTDGGSSRESDGTGGEKKKKKKKKSDKSERKSSKTKESGSVGSRSSKERELFSKMMNDAAGDDFEDDFGGFDEADFDDGFESSSKRSGALSQKTPGSISTDYFTGGATSAKMSLQMDGVTVQFPDDDLFNNSYNEDFHDFEEGDDDSVLSDMTGLTGVFSGVQLSSRPTDEYDDDQYEEMMAIMTAREEFVEANEKFSNIKRNVTTENQVKVQSKQKDKELRFSTVSVRYYERILTENPSTIKGVSIGIGWMYADKPIEDLDRYEKVRGPPKPSGHLVLPPSVREEMLVGLGYTRKDLACALRSINKARNQRRQTVENLRAEKIEEALEGAGKKVKSILNPFRRNKT